jgi:uncharacterized repeat protein (TIGR03803 family)
MRTDRLGKALFLLLAVLSFGTFPVHAQTFTVMYNFGSNTGDPLYPQRIGAIVEGKDGALYSATEQGGAYGKGAFFKITTDGKLTVLHSFDQVHDGASPDGGVTLGSDGNFYGTCYAGGAQGVGTIWKSTPTGTVTVLHHLMPDDGSYPTSAPVQGKDGNFYGATSYTDNFLLGVVYKVTPSGAYTPLYKFNGKDAATIGFFASSLIAGADGNFYGTCYRGGPQGVGTVYKITPAGAITAIHLFDRIHGATPANIMQASDGNLYGTCYEGGAANFGLVYKLTTSGDFTILHEFAATDGATPFAGVTLAKDGYLYGATKFGGTGNRGVIYRINPSGADFKVVYNRNLNMTEGLYCIQTPIQHSNGNLYGDTYEGGTKGGGVFYCIDTHIVTLAPTSGLVGATVTITGLGLTKTSSVSFNGVAAKFTVTSDTSLTVTVPMGAASGTVKIVTPWGTLSNSGAFTVLPPPPAQ